MDIATLTDDDFVAGFAACTLPPQAFSHLGHLRIAWIHLQRYPLARAVALVCDGIDAFARHLGVPQKYNRTLSEALVVLMAAGGGGDPAIGWAAFLDRNRALVDDAQAVLARHYSPAVLTGEDARTRFVAPDREPLPPCPCWGC